MKLPAGGGTSNAGIEREQSSSCRVARGSLGDGGWLLLAFGVLLRKSRSPTTAR